MGMIHSVQAAVVGEEKHDEAGVGNLDVQTRT